jgi:hypothetical protein
LIGEIILPKFVGVSVFGTCVFACTIQWPSSLRPCQALELSNRTFGKGLSATIQGIATEFDQEAAYDVNGFNSACLHPTLGTTHKGSDNQGRHMTFDLKQGEKKTLRF